MCIKLRRMTSIRFHRSRSFVNEKRVFPYVILEFFPIESNLYMSIIQLTGKFEPVRQVFLTSQIILSADFSIIGTPKIKGLFGPVIFKAIDI